MLIHVQLQNNPGREGTSGCLLHLSPKFYYVVFLFFVLTTLGTFNGIDLLINLVKCPNVSTINCNLQKGKFCVLLLEMYIILSTIVLSLYIPGERKLMYIPNGDTQNYN